MVLLPGAQNRQLAGKSVTPLQQRFVNVHTMVGTLAGTESYFTPSGRPYSHYGVGGNGAVWQWQDPTYRAASDLEGNPYSISFETEDKGPHFPAWSGSDVPYWTQAQLTSLVNGIAWLCVRYGIPPVQLEDSLPIPDGLSYHRLGIDPWRVAGGLRYSSSYGKVCPGDRRIHQFRTIVVPAVQALVIAPPPPPPSLGDLMPFPVIAAPANAVGIRPWSALLPGKVIRFVDWDPLPASSPIEQWVPGWAYYAGVEAGYFAVAKVVGDNDAGASYDRNVANAQQYSRLPVTAV